MKKRITAIIMSTALVAMFLFVGCKAKKENTVVKESDPTTAILVVSFGTSYNESRELTIGGIEDAITKAFPTYELRRAFTSQIIIDKLKQRDGLEIDNVEEALDRAVTDGIRTLIVQPTHLMDGYEYTDLKNSLNDYKEKFDQITLAEPLLTSDEDFDAVIKAITKHTKTYDDGETAIVFMGHGTSADSNGVYKKMQEKLVLAGYDNYYIGTVEATPSLEDVIAMFDTKTYKKVVLDPLMVVAGDHANNDMAGDEEDSWKTILTNKGYEVECILEGLGQFSEIQDIYVAHTQDAIDGKVVEKEDAKNENVASVSGSDLQDGTYSIEVESSSSMFRIVNALLTVKDGEMKAIITLGGQGYSKLYMGTGEEAVSADESSYVSYVEDATGAYTYEIEVEALNKELECTAFSKKKEKWYDRQILFKADTMKESTSTNEQAMIELEDGTYQIQVDLNGGSGKTTVDSPTKVSVLDGKVTATICFSSSNYDYMIVNDEKYLPVQTEGNSTFEIPVSTFDTGMKVIADTTAMSKPHEVEYELVFHKDTLQNEE